MVFFYFVYIYCTDQDLVRFIGLVGFCKTFMPTELIRIWQSLKGKNWHLLYMYWPHQDLVHISLTDQDFVDFCWTDQDLVNIYWTGKDFVDIRWTDNIW